MTSSADIIQNKLVLAKIMSFLQNNKEVTKTRLKRALSLPENHFESGYKHGVDAGFINVGAYNYVTPSKSQFVLYEEDYYDCVEAMLRKMWDSVIGKNGQYVLEKTARKDSKIAGRWTRPDFTIVSQRKFPYIKQEEFDICTFEVKRPQNCDALAVFEALAHTSAATRSFVFFPITSADISSLEQGERIEEECLKHGIGLICVDNDFALESCAARIDAQRRPLNQEKCSGFLQSVLSAGALAELSRW